MSGDCTCPSTTLEHGEQLIGVVGPDERVHFVSPPLRIDEDFRSASRRSGDAERRFRFAGVCIEDGCAQWSGGRCGVIDTVIGQAPDEATQSVGPCAIRRSCRWFAQHGTGACRICPLVVTDSRSAAMASDPPSPLTGARGEHR
jgi:hypothetical protein